MAGLDSPRVQYRWCRFLLRATWVLTAGVAAWQFWLNVRSGFIVLIVGFSLIIVEMLLRDSIVRRMEQRRKPRRTRYVTDAKASVGTQVKEEPVVAGGRGSKENEVWS